MPIRDLQKTLVELGRIRIGAQETRNGKSRPVKLETFRFTTGSRARADAVATVYGGEVRKWSPDGARQEWEVVSPVAEIPVMVPAGPAIIERWYELWSGGGCQRRCDGITNVLTSEPCACPADPAERADLAGKGRACKPTTRLRVILSDLPGAGVWRLESHGYYAATELAGTAEMLSAAAASGHPLPAVLRLEQRSAKRDGQTRRYAVPVLDVGVTPGELLGSYAAIESQEERQEETPALPAGEQPAGPDEEASKLAPFLADAPDMDALRRLYMDARDRHLLERYVLLDGGELVRLTEAFDRRAGELT